MRIIERNGSSAFGPAIFRSPAAWCFRILLILLFTSGLAFRSFAQHPPPPGTQAPTPTERGVWDQKIARLKANVTSMPIPVPDVLTSLSDTMRLTFECPEGGPVAVVTVLITTALVHWDAALAAQNSAGTYKWNRTSSVVDGHKTITCRNWVMLDSNVTYPEENSPPMGPLADEGLAYHEMLHGQLLINAMDSLAWQAAACSCLFYPEAQDGDHIVISPAVDAYVDNRAPGVNVRVVRPDPDSADEDGKFDFDLGPTDKQTWSFNVYELSSESNVDLNSITVTVENGRLHVKGKLLDKTKKGRFFVRIDPPDEWIFGGIESCLLVLPSVAIPTLTEWGLIIFGVVLIGFITWVFLRRRRAAVSYR